MSEVNFNLNDGCQNFKSRPHWDLDRIKAGLQRFIDENGRPPKAREWDKTSYLPTARTIQREFGGLEKFRQQLGYSIAHFGKGESRSKIASKVGERGRVSENRVYEILVNKFGNEFVHMQRHHGSGRQRLDFYVFSPSGNFAVDVFYPQDLYTMNCEINLKINMYSNYADDIFFVITNPDIKQPTIDVVINNKNKKLPLKCKVYALGEFLKVIDLKERYRAVKGD